MLCTQVRRSFEQLDHDGDGFITAEDLVKVLPRGAASIELAKEMLSEVTNSDGKVDYKKVCTCMAAV
jgi:calcium-dependent protein kinase